MSEVNERSRLDEAVEVAMLRYEIEVDGQTYSPNSPPEAMRAALLAGVKVLLGEPVAWAVRDHSDGKLWTFDASKRAAERIAENADDTLVPLYAPSLGEG